MRRRFQLGSNDGGAVAPTVALSLFALIAAGGLAFDYARMASMDTELQSAADQAALAAASQLTGPGACARAARAAGAALGGTDAMVVNNTLLANDGNADGIAVTTDPAAGGEDELQCNATGNIRFYRDAGKTQAATSDDDAKFVEVRVNPRASFFALTPVVGALGSGPMVAVAFASLGEAYCKVPPVMICNPTELTNAGEFDFEGLVGVGLKLVSVGGGPGGWAPGNFGYLNMPGLANGVPGLSEGLGWGTLPTNCVAANGLDTKPGANVPVTGAINTRFDIYDGNNDCQDGGICPASINSVKDLVREASSNTASSKGCKLDKDGWVHPAGNYSSIATATALPATTIPTAMGHPRDMCHAVSGDGICTGGADGRVGDGNWDRDAYFRTNYIRSSVGTGGQAIGTRWTSAEWQNNTGLAANATRYAVYVWEIANRYDRPMGVEVDGVRVLERTPLGATGSTNIAVGKPVCSPEQSEAGESYGPGTIPSPTSPDRRKFNVAVVNCVAQGVNGNSEGVQTIGFLEAFLVEPSLARGTRTGQGDVYVEVVGSSTTGVQLVSKKVPYLIE